MTDKYSRLSEKSYETTYTCFDTTIEASVEQVWPCAVDIESWMCEYRLEVLHGQRGKVGYFQRVYPPVQDTMPPPHYHYYGIAELIPHKLIALETFYEKGGSYGRTRPGMNLDLIVFADLDGRTKLNFIMAEVGLGPADVAHPAHKPTDADRARWSARLDRYFDNLKHLVSERGPASGVTS